MPVVRPCPRSLLSCLALFLASSACASDDYLILGEFTNVVYGTRTYNNGWKDWGWVPVTCTTSPVRSGSKALRLAPSGSWQAMHLVHDPIDTSLYTNLTFWLNGGAAGGQAVTVVATLGGADQASLSVGPAPTNAWKQVVLPLTSLGIANKTNFDGLYFWVAFNNRSRQSTWMTWLSSPRHRRRQCM